MQAVQNSRLLKRNRAGRIFEELRGPAKRYCNDEEWELPDIQRRRMAQLSDIAQVIQGDVTFPLPRDAAFRAHRIFGRPVWSEEGPTHINPGDPEAGARRLYQFVAKVSFLSKRFE